MLSAMSPRSLPRPSRRALLVGSGAVLTGCAGPAWDERPVGRLTIATGNRGGVFHRYGEALATVVERRLRELSVRTRNTDASVVNLRQVAAGTSDVGFSLGNVAADAIRGEGEGDRLELAALARTYDSFVHLVVRDGSPVRELADLQGRRVSIGGAGSGTRVVALRLLHAAGLGPEDIRPVTASLEPSIAALVAGEIDALFFVSGLPNMAIHRLSQRAPIRLVDLADVLSELTVEVGTEFTPGAVPASTYGVPAVGTVSVKNYLVVRPELSADVVYAVTRVVFEEQPAIEELAPGVPQPNIAAAIFTSPLPLHVGAQRYYREGRI